MKKLLFIFGTRPEAIKLAPVIKLAKASSGFEVKVLVTGQHRQMLDQVLNLFEIVPDYDLDLMKKNQDLTEISARILLDCKNILQLEKPDLVIVHGDTTTTSMAALAAFYQKIDVAHVEAGLRTNNRYSPFPEEMNRLLTSRIAKYHFAPTPNSAQNLKSEKIDEANILVTGNTVIDALFETLGMLKSNFELRKNISQEISRVLPRFGKNKFVLVTGHRRENFGSGLESICEALTQLADSFQNIDFVYPVHLNPNVQEIVYKNLSNRKNIFLIEPLDYLPFVYVMSECSLVITDSGGIQEEAPSLGKMVLVTRDVTERMEAVESGSVRLVGTSTKKIVTEASKYLSNIDKYAPVSDRNPYGDGKASKRLIDFLIERNPGL